MMSNYITHFSSPKQNNDIIVYHHRTKSSFTESTTPRTNTRRLFSDLTKDSEINLTSRNPTPEKQKKIEINTPRSGFIASPKFLNQKEFLKSSGTQRTNPEKGKSPIDPEKENIELKKQINSLETRISSFVKENENLQKRLYEYKAQQKMFDHASRDTDSIKKELEVARRKIKELEQENAKIQHEKAKLIRSNENEEIDRRLSKYTKYIISYLHKADTQNFIRFFFEERFISERNIYSLLKAKEYATIALQAFRYIGDLLAHTNVPSQPLQEQKYYSDRREYNHQISEPSSICLSPFRKESLDITPRDLVTEMMEGMGIEQDGFDKVHYDQETTSYKTPRNANNNKGRLQNASSKVVTPHTSGNKTLTVRNAKTETATPQGNSPVKKVMSPKGLKHQQSHGTLLTLKDKPVSSSKLPPKLEIRQMSYKELSSAKQNQPLSSQRRNYENTEKSLLDSERAILSLESARRRNTQKLKEADPQLKDPKGNVKKLNLEILDRRDNYKLEDKFSSTERKGRNFVEREFEEFTDKDYEQIEKKPLTSGRSILKNGLFENENIRKRTPENIKLLEIEEDEINTLRQRITGAQAKRTNSKTQEYLELQITTNNNSTSFEHDQERNHILHSHRNKKDNLPEHTRENMERIELKTKNNYYSALRTENNFPSESLKEKLQENSYEKILHAIPDDRLYYEKYTKGKYSPERTSKENPNYKRTIEIQSSPRVDHLNSSLGESPQLRDIEKRKIFEKTPNKIRQDEGSTFEKKTERFVTFDGTDPQNFIYGENSIGRRTPKKSPGGQNELTYTKIQDKLEQQSNRQLERISSSSRLKIASKPSRRDEVENIQKVSDILKDVHVESARARQAKKIPYE